MKEGLSAIPFDNFFELNDNSRTRGHTHKLKRHLCRLDVRKYFFSERVIDKWNRLTDQAVEATSINGFKNQLDKIRKTRKDLLWTTSLPGPMAESGRKFQPGEASPGELPGE
jgi:hypothetical protein